MLNVSLTSSMPAALLEVHQGGEAGQRVVVRAGCQLHLPAEPAADLQGGLDAGRGEAAAGAQAERAAQRVQPEQRIDPGNKSKRSMAFIGSRSVVLRTPMPPPTLLRRGLESKVGSDSD